MKRPDKKDLMLLDYIASLAPRNINRIARKMGIPPETVRKRLKSLSSHFPLKCHINIYHTNLGLKKAVVIANARSGYEDGLLEAMKANDFWIYVTRVFGDHEGCLGIYTIPKQNCKDFEEFITKITESNIAVDAKIYWSTCFHAVQSRSKWFDDSVRTYIFKWEDWINEVINEKVDLPFTLKDPEDFRVLADKTDILILKELEKDATVSFQRLGEILGISPQLISYHYRKHIIPNNLIEGFQVTFFHFDLNTSERVYFIFDFDNYTNMAKFANSLLDKPFAVILGKILGRNSLFGYLYFPRKEFRRFMDALSKLARVNFIKSYTHLIQDLGKTYRQTISYEYFNNGRWIYDHTKHLRKLEEVLSNFAG